MVWWLSACLAPPEAPAGPALHPSDRPQVAGPRSFPTPTPVTPSPGSPAVTASPGSAPVSPGRTVVIGAGPAGLAAAMDLGGEVVLLEADAAVGGRARWAGGRMFFVGSEEALAAGWTEGVDRLLDDWETMTGAPPSPATWRFLAESDAVRDRLAGLGARFVLAEEDPVVGGWPKSTLEGGGAELVRLLAEAVPDPVDLRLSTPATALVLDGDRVLGVEVDGALLPADHVIVASGGFVNRADLVDRVTPDPPGSWGVGTDPGAQGWAFEQAITLGLGVTAAEAVGWNGDVVALPGADGRPLGFDLGGGVPWVWVDASGERFVDESANWSVEVAGRRRATPGVWAVAAWDRLVAQVDDADLLVAARDADALVRCRADDDALADALGVDPAGLAATRLAVAAYADGTAADPHGRPGRTFPTDAGEPCGFVPGGLASKNFGGLSVDSDGRVLDADGRVVRGLWAVGEAAGMGAPGLGGAWGFDGSLSAVVWSGWRTAAAIERERWAER